MKTLRVVDTVLALFILFILGDMVLYTLGWNIDSLSRMANYDFGLFLKRFLPLWFEAMVYFWAFVGLLLSIFQIAQKRKVLKVIQVISFIFMTFMAFGMLVMTLINTVDSGYSNNITIITVTNISLWLIFIIVGLALTLWSLMSAKAGRWLLGITGAAALLITFGLMILVFVFGRYIYSWNIIWFLRMAVLIPVTALGFMTQSRPLAEQTPQPPIYTA